MKQSEKSKLTYEKILNAAIVEFGTKSYDGASLNTICNEFHISKGLLYHNFKNKDELYLCTVEACYKAMIEFLSKGEYQSHDITTTIRLLLDKRYQFFREYPYYSHIFFHSVLQPPKHLLRQMKEIKEDLDSFNTRIYKQIISRITLRSVISEEEALDYFCSFQELFNNLFQSRANETSDFDLLIEEHEKKLSKMINIMLYGIAKEEQTHDTFID